MFSRFCKKKKKTMGDKQKVNISLELLGNTGIDFTIQFFRSDSVVATTGGEFRSVWCQGSCGLLGALLKGTSGIKCCST